MCERKPWSQQEDNTLKLLKQSRKVSRWSEISRIMKEQFQIFGRNGKQCRERYHNHLDSRISKKKWDPQQEKKLLSLHNQWGNRWAAISRELPGRTDNCVKNHFYSCFRKCIKGVNTTISKQSKKKIRPLKLGIITKIVSIIQSFHKDSENFDRNLYQWAKKIKIQILSFNENTSVTSQKNMKNLQDLIKNISQLNKISRNKFLRKKKVKLEEQISQELNGNLNMENQISGDHRQKNRVKGKNKTLFLSVSGDVKKMDQQGIKIQQQPYRQIQASYKIKHEQYDNINQNYYYQNEPEQEQPPNSTPTPKSKPHTLTNPQPQQIPQQIQLTPIRQKKQDKQRNSSYYGLNSVDCLDGKNYVIHDIRDFIYMDDEKQWKLYFQ